MRFTLLPPISNLFFKVLFFEPLEFKSKMGILVVKRSFVVYRYGPMIWTYIIQNKSELKVIRRLKLIYQKSIQESDAEGSTLELSLRIKSTQGDTSKDPLHTRWYKTRPNSTHPIKDNHSMVCSNTSTGLNTTQTP